VSRTNSANGSAGAAPWPTCGPEYRGPVAQLSLDVERAKLKDLGVSLDDVMNTLRVYLGDFRVNDRAGRGVQVSVRSPGEKGIADLKMLKVRNGNGEMVALGAVAAVRELAGAPFLRRIDGQRCLLITPERRRTSPPARPAAAAVTSSPRRGRSSNCRTLPRRSARPRRSLKGLPDKTSADQPEAPARERWSLAGASGWSGFVRGSALLHDKPGMPRRPRERAVLGLAGRARGCHTELSC